MINFFQSNIVYEDDDLLVLNKPAGVVVNEAKTTTKNTVQSAFTEYLTHVAKSDSWQAMVPADYDSTYGNPEEIFHQRAGIVHRLDKDTSGILILAKNPGSLVHLLSQFKVRSTEKEYTCLTHGKFNIDSDTIDMPIGRASKDRKTFEVRIDGRNAVTHYSVIEHFPRFNEKKWLALINESKIENANYHYSGNHKKYFKIYQGFTLVKCVPKTGRTHQIRVHMAHIHHPIVGDITYAGNKRNRADALWCARQFLHASQLTVTHPRTDERMTFNAPLSPDLVQALELVGDN